ncbi:putative sucrose utilization SUC1 [Hyphodiscus hymeniophilus]|uniref:Sucrose utilization SUC1 n=1 Tax=Hyphodiscus hymeniophilus TaxID=353542 RepID=A0A9P7AUB9_9HELO|nr:putative sucrose utilization SUC1 [Hyphodiscus hymeniophilus]
MPKPACDCCNIRKIKCHGDYPCARCIDNGLTCTFLRQRRKSGPRNIRQRSMLKIWEEQTVSARLAMEETQPIGPFSPGPVATLHRIPLAILSIALRMYGEKLYGIWPLLNAESLIQRLESEPNNPDIYVLATALSGATLSHLNQVVVHETLSEPQTADSFIADSKRVRSEYDYMESITLNTTLTSYFLHIFYGRQPARAQTATFYIREAITFAQLFGMHIEDTYSRYSIKDQQVMRKLYFLLFMTERYLCINDGLPTVLESINLPITDDEELPDVVSGFLNLVTLFNTPGTDFFSKWTSHSSNTSINRERLLLIQHALQRPLEIPNYANDIQKVDIVVSQHWMRSLAWKLSIQLGYVMLNSKREMNVGYPLEIAQDALGGIAQFSPETFEVHGPGMEVKTYEIANVLADSIQCKPEEQSSLWVGPKDTLHTLAGVFFSLKVVNPDLRNKLSAKLDLIFGGSMLPRSMDVVPEVEDSKYDENVFSAASYSPTLDEFLLFT